MGFESEKDIQNKILAYLQKHPAITCCFQPSAGITASRKFRGVGRSMPKGVPDLIGCFSEKAGENIAGKFFGVEVKKPGGRPSPEQITFIESLEQNKAYGLVAFSLGDVLQWLNRILSSSASS